MTISGIPVGGLTPDEARTVVQERFELGLPLVLDRKHRLAPPPSALGAVPHYDEALAKAQTAQPGQAVTLPVLIDGAVVRAYVQRVAQRFYRKPVDAQVFLRKLKPVVVPDRPGLVVNRPALTQTIVVATAGDESRASPHQARRLAGGRRRQGLPLGDRRASRLQPPLSLPL